MLKSDFFDYSKTYIVPKSIMTAEDTNANNETDQKVIFTNDAPFRSYISKINNIFIDNTKNLILICQRFIICLVIIIFDIRKCGIIIEINNIIIK